MPRETLPRLDNKHDEGDQTRIVVAAAWTDPSTGQVFVHRDLVPAAADWEREEHIGPTKITVNLGDVASWAAYVTRYLQSGSLLTWNSGGIVAVLDYPADPETPGRCQWIARQPFRRSTEWESWTAFANSRALSQRDAIERLEDLAEDIVDPAPADITLLLRKLRANATAEAETEIRPDGTAAVTFRKDAKVSGGGAELPPVIRVAIPVLAGDAQRYELRVRMRASVDDNARLTFRFSLVNAERVLEAVYAARVAAAQAALGEDRQLLRADG